MATEYNFKLGGEEEETTQSIPQAAAPPEDPTAWLNPEMLKAISFVESRWDPRAVSPAGAQGYFQVMPETARQPAFGVDPLEDPFDPVASEVFAKNYLGGMQKYYPDFDEYDVLRGYNAGHGTVLNVRKGKQKYTQEAYEYPFKVFGALKAIQEGRRPSEDDLRSLLKAQQDGSLAEITQEEPLQAAPGQGDFDFSDLGQSLQGGLQKVSGEDYKFELGPQEQTPLGEEGGLDFQFDPLDPPDITEETSTVGTVLDYIKAAGETYAAGAGSLIDLPQVMLGEALADFGKPDDTPGSDLKYLLPGVGGATLLTHTIKTLFPETVEKINEYGERVEKKNLEEYEEGLRAGQAVAEKTKGILGEAVAGGLYSMGVATPVVATALITKNPGVFTMAPLVGHSMLAAAVDYKKQGIEGAQRVIGSVLEGAVEYATEKYALKALFSDAGKHVLKKVVNFLAREEASELAATFLQYGVRESIINPDMSVQEFAGKIMSPEFGRELAVTALATPIAASGQIAVVDGGRKLGKGIFGTREFEEIKDLDELDRRIKEKFTDLGIETAELQVKDLEKEYAKRLEQAEKILIDATQQALPKEVEQLAQTRNKFSDLSAASSLGYNQDPASNSYGKVFLQNLIKKKSDGTTTNLFQEAAAAGEIMVLRSDTETRKIDLENKQQTNNLSPMEQNELNGLDKQLRKEAVIEKKLTDLMADLYDVIYPQNKLNKYSTATQPAIAFKFEDYARIGEDKTQGSAHASKVQNGVPLRVIRINTNLVSNVHELTRVVAHEIGHTVHQMIYDNSSYELKKLMNDYWKNTVASHLKKPALEFFEKVTTPSRYKDLKENWGHIHNVTLEEFFSYMQQEKGYGNSIDDEQYFASSAEFYAELMAKHASNKTAIGKIIQQEFPQYPAYAKKIAESIDAEFGTSTGLNAITNTYDVWTRLGTATQELSDLKKRYKEAVKNMTDDPPMRVVSKRVGGLLNKVIKDTKLKERVMKDVDRFNFFIANFWSITHWAALNRHIPQLQQMLELDTQRHFMKMQYIDKANSIAEKWQEVVPRKQSENFDAFLFIVDKVSTEKGRTLTGPELVTIVQDNNLDISPKMFEFAQELWQFFRDAVTAMEVEAVADAQDKFSNDPIVMQDEVARLRRDFQKLRDRNYMPHTRFGRHTVYLKAEARVEIDGKTYRKGEVISFELYETKSEQEAAYDKWIKKLGPKAATVFYQKGILSDAQGSLVGMPPELLSLLEKDLNLTDEQQDQLKNLAYRLGPTQGFRKNLLNRQNVAGFSDHGLRVFADYFSRFANHISRTKYSRLQKETIEDLKKDTAKRKGDVRKRDMMINALTSHLEYIDNPGNELATLRALGFIWYLGWVPKSALVNFSQVPMIALPWLASHSGNIDASASLLSALRDVGDRVNKGKNYSEDELKMFKELAPLLDESNATELAAVTEGSVLQRYLPGSARTFAGKEKIARVIRDGGKSASYMFQKAENLNRQVTALAAFRLAKNSGKSLEDSVAFARDAVRETMFEYARFNRATFMRGKKSVFTLFWQYMTNSTFYTIYGPGKYQYLLQLFMIAGLMGMPGAENIEDLVNFLGTKIARLFGIKDWKLNAEFEIRKAVTQIHDMLPGAMQGIVTPDTFMNGYATQVGPFDLSGSMSAGRILPTQALDTNKGGAQMAGEALISAGGAMVELPMGIIRAVGSDSPDVWKRMEYAMPMMARNISKALRRGIAGEERDFSGAVTKDYNTESWEDMFTLAGQAAGFPDREITVTSRARFMAKEAVEYWKSRASIVLAEVYYALERQDYETVTKLVTERIPEFNRNVPKGVVGIDSDSIRASIRRRKTQAFYKENNLTSSPKYQGLYREYIEVYDQQER